MVRWNRWVQMLVTTGVFTKGKEFKYKMVEGEEELSSGGLDLNVPYMLKVLKKQFSHFVAPKSPVVMIMH